MSLSDHLNGNDFCHELLFLIMKEVHFWELLGKVEVWLAVAEVGGTDKLLLG